MSKYVGESCTLSVLRKGEPLEITVTVAPPVYLVPVQMYDKSPTYFIFAGFVFVPLTRPFMRHQVG